MARGWESKSVESQMEDRDSFTGPVRNTHADASLERELEVLKLARKRLLHEMEGVSNPRFLELKRRALAHVENSIAALARLAPTMEAKGRDSMKRCLNSAR